MDGIFDVFESVYNALDQEGLDRRSKLETAGRLIHLLKQKDFHICLKNLDHLFCRIRKFLWDSDTSVRAACFRVIRHALRDASGVELVHSHNIHIFLVRAMERDVALLWERMQALKLFRTMMSIESSLLSVYSVRSLVAISSQKDDNLRRVCLETLRELAICNTGLVAHCDGFRVLIDSIIDPVCHDLAEPLVLTILYILNEYPTRKFLSPEVDIQVLLAPFTDMDAPAGNERRQRWHSSRNAIITMMRSWTGILVLTSHPRGLRSLIQLFIHPVGEDIQHAILQLVYDLFNLSMPSSSTSSTFSSGSIFPSQYHAIPPHNLLDNYSILILLSLVHCGLIESLIILGMGSKKNLSGPAIHLLGIILRMSSYLLPEEHCARLLAVPELVKFASTFTSCSSTFPSISCSYDPDNDVRSQSMRASIMLSELANAVGSGLSNGKPNPMSQYVNGVQMASELLRDTNLRLAQITTTSNTTTTTGLTYVGNSRERMVHELKASLDAQMDDTTFKDMLFQRSRVLLGKDWYKWDWDIISELLEGPLTHSNRLSEAMKTKFFKRLSGFFRCDPGNKGYFAQLPWIPDYVPYVRPACQMYTLLLHHPEGLQFLKSDRRGQLLSEIAAALELEARPEAAIVESHIGALQARMFSPEFCSRRMLREYFTLLGLMTSSKEGLRLLEQSNLFQRLYVMGKMQGHDFLCRLILANLDYTVDGSSRNLLQLWMTNGSKPLRLYATCLLRALLRSAVADFASWGIDVLVTQLYQEDEVAQAALSVLEEAAQSPEYLLAMIMKRPQKLVNLPSANNLLLRFLSLPEGLAFLKDMEWISVALQQWRRKDYISYVHVVEKSLMKGLNRDINGPNQESNTPIPVPVYVPEGHRPGRSNNSYSGDREEAHWRFAWLFRLPWNMEVKIIGPPGSGPPSNLTLDTFVDASQIRSYEDKASSDANPIKVKGIVVDARNIPQPLLVNSQQTLQCCLFLGTQPVDRKGFTKPPPQSNGGFIQSYSNFISNQKDKHVRGRSRSASSETGRKLSGDLSDVNGADLAGGITCSDEHKDWSSCRPEQRAGSALHSPESSFCAPGERALWTFAVDEGSDTEGKAKKVWLKSVEFTLQLLPHRKPNVPLPPHLYGELVKTNSGCTILRQSGHVPEFLQSLKDPSTVPLERRADLWALGHIAASSRGFELIRKCSDDFLETVLSLARSSNILSIRGTCFYVLGLISRSGPGRKALSAHDWDSPKDPRATIAVPRDISQLFQIPCIDSKNLNLSEQQSNEISSSSLSLPPLRNEWKDVLKNISNLCNHITQKDAHLALNRLKSQQPELFENPKLALHAFHKMEAYVYRLPVRQFIHNLFDKAPIYNILWEKSKESNPKEALTSIVSRRRAYSASLSSSTVRIPRSMSRRLSMSPVRPRSNTLSKSSSSSFTSFSQIPLIKGSTNVEGLKTASTLSWTTSRKKNKSKMSNTIFVGAPVAIV